MHGWFWQTMMWPPCKNNSKDVVQMLVKETNYCLKKGIIDLPNPSMFIETLGLGKKVHQITTFLSVLLYLWDL